MTADVCLTQIPFLYSFMTTSPQVRLKIIEDAANLRRSVSDNEGVLHNRGDYVSITILKSFVIYIFSRLAHDISSLILFDFNGGN